MKKILLLTWTLFAAPLFAGRDCINKQGNSLACPCNCDAVRGRYCTNCTHLQNAQNYTVITPSFAKASEGTATPAAKTMNNKSYDPQDVLNKLAVRYLQNK